MKKLLAVFLSILLLCACIPLGAIPVMAATSGATGSCMWVLDGTHLTISGNGAMEDYTHQKFLPWGDEITSVTIDDGVTTIGAFALASCYSLASITIPDSVISIGSYAFSHCNLTSIHFGNGITTIGDNAFYGCKLTSVIIPNSVVTIGEGAFQESENLTSVVIGDGVTSIGEQAFYRCDNLSALTIGNSVSSIGDSAFYWCTSLTSVTIPDSVTHIGDFAFFDLPALKTMFLGKNVEVIGFSAFDGMIPDTYGLTDVYYTGSEADRANIDINTSNVALLNATWHYNYTPEPTATLGDLNGDGRINNRDLGLLQQHLAEWDVEIDLDACDLNADGRVNNRDLGLLQQYLADWDVTLG